MSALALRLPKQRARLGLKGPRAAEWLTARGIVVPTAPNTWAQSEETVAGDELLVARLGANEFFLEGGVAGTALKGLAASLDQDPGGGHPVGGQPRGGRPPGVYPVLREDWAFQLAGERVHDVLAQVCNVNFAALPLASHPLIMTLMIGVAILVVPQSAAGAQANVAEGRDAAERQYRIWCDPTFGPYLSESLGAVVIECGGSYTGVSG
jgi:sarcosine oxidase, subunit gamma